MSTELKLSELYEIADNLHIVNFFKMSTEQLIKAIKNAKIKKENDSRSMNMISLNTYNVTSYVGVYTESISSLIYIMYKFKKYCGVVPNSFLHNKLSEMSNIKNLDWSNIMINITNSKTLTFPKGFFKQFDKCLKTSERFIFFPLNFQNKRIAHANYMLYDKNTNEMERFEPNGEYTNSEIIPEIIDESLVYVFNDRYNKNGNKFIRKYYKPLSFCPYYSFQYIQGTENKQTKKDPSGFCAAWSTWYIELRFSNPNINRKQLVNLSIEKLKNNNKSLTSYIRSYSVLLRYIHKNLLQDVPIKDIFKNIDKYIKH